MTANSLFWALHNTLPRDENFDFGPLALPHVLLGCSQYARDLTFDFGSVTVRHWPVSWEL